MKIYRNRTILCVMFIILLSMFSYYLYLNNSIVRTFIPAGLSVDDIKTLSVYKEYKDIDFSQSITDIERNTRAFMKYYGDNRARLEYPNGYIDIVYNSNMILIKELGIYNPRYIMIDEEDLCEIIVNAKYIEDTIEKFAIEPIKTCYIYDCYGKEISTEYSWYVNTSLSKVSDNRFSKINEQQNRIYISGYQEDISGRYKLKLNTNENGYITGFKFEE